MFTVPTLSRDFSLKLKETKRVVVTFMLIPRKFMYWSNFYSDVIDFYVRCFLRCKEKVCGLSRISQIKHKIHSWEEFSKPKPRITLVR